MISPTGFPPPLPCSIFVEVKKDSRDKEGMSWRLGGGTLFALKCIGNISGVSSLTPLTYLEFRCMGMKGPNQHRHCPKHMLHAGKPQNSDQSPQRKVSCPADSSTFRREDRREEPAPPSIPAPTNHHCFLSALKPSPLGEPGSHYPD